MSLVTCLLTGRDTDGTLFSDRHFVHSVPLPAADCTIDRFYCRCHFPSRPLGVESDTLPASGVLGTAARTYATLISSELHHGPLCHCAHSGLTECTQVECYPRRPRRTCTHLTAPERATTVPHRSVDCSVLPCVGYCAMRSRPVEGFPLDLSAIGASIVDTPFGCYRLITTLLSH